MHRARASKRAVFIAAALAAAAGAYVFAAPEEWRHVGQLLLLVPAVAGGLSFGIFGGVVAGLAAAVVYYAGHPHSGLSAAIEFALYIAAGAVAGWLAEREARSKRAWADAVRQLTDAHAELRQSFEGMKRAERLFSLGQLSAGLAHEIRNPLASIAGAVRILQRHAGPDPKQAECLEIIDKESQRLNRLLTNFLDFARPRRPQFHPVDVAASFAAVISLASHGLARDNVALRSEVEPALPHPECDAEQLQQVLLNLTINAIQASPDGGEVVLAALRSGPDEVTIEVRDSGVGVPPEHVDRLFDPFFTTKQNGTGLGLPVAHEIVRGLGGTLAARPNAGRGMTFSILLPVRRQILA